MTYEQRLNTLRAQREAARRARDNARRRQNSVSLTTAASIYGSGNSRRLEGDRSRVSNRPARHAETRRSNLGFAADRDR